VPRAAPFGSLDFLYVPSRDVAGELRWFEEVLGGRAMFAIDSMGTRVAAVELSEDPPLVLLTDHLEGDRPILVYRVPDLDAALGTLEARGWRREHRFEIPHGPICSFEGPGSGPGEHRVALYQLTRTEVGEHFEGRRDF
jgi:hypothetical protein